jgi:hypothetical protein
MQFRAEVSSESIDYARVVSVRWFQPSKMRTRLINLADEPEFLPAYRIGFFRRFRSVVSSGQVRSVGLLSVEALDDGNRQHTARAKCVYRILTNK